MRGNTNSHINGDYNIYGRLVTKRKKGCAFYYSLLNTHAKSDGWVKSSIKIESDAENEGLSWECDTQYIVDIVKQINKTPYLNRLKQFFLRLLRNNLFFGNTKHNNSPTCVICGQHSEKRIPALMICDVTVSLVNRLTGALREANLLRNDDIIECFLYKTYGFNTAQNLSLVFLWDFMYKASFFTKNTPPVGFFSI